MNSVQPVNSNSQNITAKPPRPRNNEAEIDGNGLDGDDRGATASNHDPQANDPVDLKSEPRDDFQY